jgi:hypothetical protein
MMKKILVGILVMLATLAFAEPQTLCPIMGGKINKAQYVDVEGYRIYVCCKGCIKPIQAEPKKIIAKMKAAGVEPEKAPEK